MHIIFFTPAMQLLRSVVSVLATIADIIAIAVMGLILAPALYLSARNLIGSVQYQPPYMWPELEPMNSTMSPLYIEQVRHTAMNLYENRLKVVRKQMSYCHKSHPEIDASKTIKDYIFCVRLLIPEIPASWMIGGQAPAVDPRLLDPHTIGMLSPFIFHDTYLLSPNTESYFDGAHPNQLARIACLKEVTLHGGKRFMNDNDPCDAFLPVDYQ